MHRRTTTISAALATAAAALLLTACSTDAPRPATASSPAAPSTAHTYDEHDCRAVLERDFDDDNLYNAHPEPECEHLTRDEYIDVVKDVLDGRTDEIYEDVSQHIIWDEAWEQTDPAQQELVCDRLWADGAKVVGREMADETGDDEAEQIEMAEYLLDEKC